MEQKNRVLRITRTAVLIALLVVLQAALMPLNNSLITGSIVNLVLIISVMTCGLSSGLCVAAVSPVIARLFGIGPLWSLIPFIAAGNAALVVLLAFHRKPQHRRKKSTKPVWLRCSPLHLPNFWYCMWESYGLPYLYF